MSRLYVDPPSGWRYGFPRVWDSEKDPAIHEWLKECGYPDWKDPAWVRYWEADDVQDNK